MTAMGFNPYRKFRARGSDYVLVASALFVVAVLVGWAVFA
jgi:hypothetical protein